MPELRTKSAPASVSENRPEKKNRFNKCTKQEMNKNISELGNCSSKHTAAVQASGSFDTLR
jgi:hypothetical protein